MKSPLFSKFITLAIAVLLTTSAFAGAAHKGNLQVSDPVQVNGKMLPAGDYTVTWSGDGPNVNVNIARGSKVLATVAAKIVTLDQKASEDAAEVKNSSTGSRELLALRFSGQKTQLEITGDGGQGKAGDSVK
jgi:hypothetical protein